MGFIIIAAKDAANGIGKNGKLPWNLQADLKHFKESTVGRFDDGLVNAVIMGRTTWLSLPDSVRPMPKRLNIVLTTKPEELQVSKDVFVAKNLAAALDLAREYASGDIFVIGGAKVYAEAIVHPECATLMLTEVEGIHDCDAQFPAIPSEFRRTSESEVIHDAGETYRFVVYKR